MANCTQEKINEMLAQIARTAAVMFDGELCGEIVTQRSWKWMDDIDPNDQYRPHDNYDVEHAPFVVAKKTLMRLQRLAPDDCPVQCLLWVPVPTIAGQWAVICWNGGPSRWWIWGGLHMDPPGEIVKAFETGEPQTADPEGGKVLTVVTPVKDSLKEIVGVIEVSASTAEAAINW